MIGARSKRNRVNYLEELLKLTYKRELELERKLEGELTKNKWFVEDTKRTNIYLQIRCLEEMDKIKTKYKHLSGLH